MTAVSTHVRWADILIARDLRLTPMHAIDDGAGHCMCEDVKCGSPGKHPRWTAGHSTSGTDWWATHPNDPVAIDREASHVVTVEDDGQLREWCESIGLELAPTLTLVSPTGHERYVYRLPADTPLHNWIKPDGYAVDILSKGRAPGPGVRRPDGVYGLVADHPVADAPAALVTWLREKAEARAAESVGIVQAEDYDGPLPLRVQELLDLDEAAMTERWPQESDDDRNSSYLGVKRGAATFALIGACYDSGLSQAEAVGVAENYDPAEDKYGHRAGGVASQVADCWGKISTPEPDWLIQERTPTLTEWFADGEGEDRWRALAERRGIQLPTLRSPMPPAAPMPPSNGDQPTGQPAPQDAPQQEQGTVPARRSLASYLLDIEGLRNIPKPEPLIEGWLYADSLAWLVGTPGHGKTLVAVDLACSVATGSPWFEHKVTQGRVLYLIAEGAKGLSVRVDAWASDRATTVTDVDFLPVAVQLFTDKPVVEELRQLLIQRQYAFVVIDTQARISIGADENSAKDMGQLIATLDRLRGAGGACVLVVHHTPRTGSNPRGSTAIEGAADTILSCDKDGPQVKLTNPKQKNAAEAGPITMMLRPTSASVVLTRDLDIRDLSASQAKVLETLDTFGGEASATTLIDATGLSRTSVYRVLKLLLARELVTTERSGRNVRFMRVKSPETLPETGDDMSPRVPRCPSRRHPL
jgi:DNA-binding transcriptional ArsR family regulator